MSDADWKSIAKIKRGVCTRLRRLIKPLTWQSGYADTRLFVFEMAGMGESYKVRNTLEREYSESGIRMFYQAGVADACGGGCACTAFESIAVEDLMRIELLVRRLYPRMQAGAKAFKKSMEERANAKEA